MSRKSPFHVDVFQDWDANRGYPKSQIVMLSFRVANRQHRPDRMTVRYRIAATLYKIWSEWLLGIELPPSTRVGARLRLRHGVGLVVNPHTLIGADVMLRHGVTLGNRHHESDCPRIEDGVEIGAMAIVIGPVRVGAGARIGAGAIVVDDIPDGMSVVGAKGRLLLRQEQPNAE
ncbi:serine acetyltransferase [Microbacterium lacus]|uniref:serine acetyltransferase n=1 Tax=Microbacterium lacus TaxID=415217 RepID=UPI00384C4F24